MKLVFLKMLGVSVLTVVILIALAAVRGVLESRASYREEAVASIAQSSAGAHRLARLVLFQPYIQLMEDVTKGERRVELRAASGPLWYLGFIASVLLN